MVSNSKYKDDTLIFVIEDDAQDGPDYVDAHRTIAYVIGPYVKRGEVVSTRYSTVNTLRTIEDILHLKPMGLNDGLEPPMTDVITRDAKPWQYTPIVPAVLRTTQLPLDPRPRQTHWPKPCGSGRSNAQRTMPHIGASRCKGWIFPEATMLPRSASTGCFEQD